jgi:hypothetical protein
LAPLLQSPQSWQKGLSHIVVKGVLFPGTWNYLQTTQMTDTYVEDEEDQDALLDEFSMEEEKERERLGITAEGQSCLLEFLAKIARDGIDPCAAKEALASIEAVVDNPIPPAANIVRDSAEGVVARLLAWTFIFVIVVVLAIIWALVASKSMRWQVALILTFFILIFALLIALVIKANLNSYISSREDILSMYLNNWYTANAPIIPGAISNALCVYVNPANCPPPPGVGGIGTDASPTEEGGIRRRPCATGGCH